MIPTAALRERVTIELYRGDTAYGPSWADPIDGVPIRIVGKRRAVRTREGVDVIASAVGQVRPTFRGSPLEVPGSSRITRADGSTWIVLDVANAEELSSPHHRDLILEGPT